MTILWINLAIVFLFSFASRYFSQLYVSDSIVYSRPNKFLAICVMACLFVISGLRNGIGDTYFYKHAYNVTDFEWEYVKSMNEIGFGILQMILKMYTEDPQVLIFLVALVTNVLIVAVFYNYSKLFELSTYVYITGGTFLVSMNGLRQMLAAAICFIAIKYLLDQKFFKYTLIILLATTFHQSAFIMIPVYFLVRFKAWSKATILILSFSVLVVIGYDIFASLFFTALEHTKYGNYATFDEGGANMLRVAVNAAPLVIAYLGRDKLREVFPKSDYIVNMSIIGLLFMIISTQSWIFARVSLYFTLYQLILVSWIIEVFSKRDQKLVYYSILFLYFLYYYYENVISLNIIYKSDIIDSILLF